LAFTLAKKRKIKPQVIAEEIKQKITQNKDLIKEVNIEKGFINIKVKDKMLWDILREINLKREDFGKSNEGKGKKVLIEFISANPTGPLHIGHGRGAIYGDVLSNIFKFLGYSVEKEYYVNDRGKQVELLIESVKAEYLKAVGEEVKFPENGYKGEYIRNIALSLKDKFNKSFNLDTLAEYSISSILSSIKNTLKNFGVEMDNFVFESSFYNKKNKNFLKKLLDKLKKMGYIYNKEEAVYFKSSLFGDSEDRVIIKKNKEYTYFTSDILYHIQKYQRSYDLILNIWGADHHGYIPRLKAILNVLGYDLDKLKILLYQMVHLLKGGKKVTMSTRNAQYITLDELIDEVGKDATRFFLLFKADTPIEFDIEEVKKHSLDNPLYYIQYAHARCCGILKRKKVLTVDSLDRLSLPQERRIILRLSTLEDELRECLLSFEPYRLVLYLLDLVKEFHNYYMHHKVLSSDEELTNARLYMIAGIKQVINNALNILGVEAPERM
jgi:arginyl-tRNA synthetase